jgi:hypothetical protein
MYRQRNSGYRRRARAWRAWAACLSVVAACGAAVVAIHLVGASKPLNLSSSAFLSQAWKSSTDAAKTAKQGYGHGGDTMMPRREATASATTQNWAGYTDLGQAGAFTSVATSWVQPAVTCTAAQTFSSFWVGLDGVGTQTLEQTGTEADCENGTPVYAGWYELFPAAPVFYNSPVQAGDQMSASVVANGGGSFTLTLADASEGWKQVTNKFVTGSTLSSAEVVAEAPSSQSVLPLANFGTVNFTNATVNGQGIGNDGPIALTMVSGAGVTEATPSALNDNDNFTVTWDSSGDTATTGTGNGTGTGTGTGRHHHHHQDQSPS